MSYYRSTDGSLDIHIPAKHYVGFCKRQHADDMPLGFMTIEGTDKAAMSRKSTVDRWSDKSIPAKVFDNKPLAGFRLSRQIKRNSRWGGSGTVVWRIQDPRGFELEISSENFAMILMHTVVDQGEFQARCIWGRLGKDNVLICEGSELYERAVANTERQNKSVSKRDVKPGDYVVLQNGVEGKYLGDFFLYSWDHIYHKDENKNTCYSDSSYIFKSNSKKKSIILVDETQNGMVSESTLKVSSFTEGDALDIKETEAFLNQHKNKISGEYGVEIISADKLVIGKDIMATLEECAEPSFSNTCSSSNYNRYIMTHNIDTGSWGILYFTSDSKYDTTLKQHFYTHRKHITRITDINLLYTNLEYRNKVTSSKSYNYSRTTMTESIDNAQQVKYYRIVVSGTTPNGTKFTVKR